MYRLLPTKCIDSPTIGTYIPYLKEEALRATLVMIIATHRNLTTISTIIDNIYSHYPQRKLFSPTQESKSRNNIAVNLLPRQS
jgi:hypothetical protein